MQLPGVSGYSDVATRNNVQEELLRLMEMEKAIMIINHQPLPISQGAEAKVCPFLDVFHPYFSKFGQTVTENAMCLAISTAVDPLVYDPWCGGVLVSGELVRSECYG